MGVHTTQFAIRNPQIGLFGPLLRLAAVEFNRLDLGRKWPLIRVAGVCGETRQAVAEASLRVTTGSTSDYSVWERCAVRISPT